MCNPYLAFALLIRAGLDGVRRSLSLPPAADVNLYTAPAEVAAAYQPLPASLADAKMAARRSDFIARSLPVSIISSYTN